MSKNYYVYFTASQKRGTIYTGITSDLPRRISEHKQKIHKGSFSEKYHVNKLVYYETYDDPDNAIRREKRFKKWLRNWKIELIEQHNPDWKDLFDDICG